MTSSYDSSGITFDRYNDIMTRLVALAQEQWGASVDTSEDEFLGHMLRIQALLTSEINEIVQNLYDSISISNATGTTLDNLCSLIGVSRQAAAYSTATLTLTATAATTVPAGTQYKTAAGVIFATDEEVVFASAGSDDIDATCTVVGPYDADIGEIDTIVNPIYGISAVTNAAAAIPGKYRDTDAELRRKHTLAVANTGACSASAIIEAIFDVYGVSDVYLLDNSSDDTASDGTPPWNVHISVIGGDGDDIAEAVVSNITEGVPTYGSSSGTWYNEATSQNYTIYYDEALDTQIYISIEGSKINGLWPGNGEDLIKEYLIDHFEDIHINDDVVYTALYKPIYTVPGLIVTSLKVDTSYPASGTTDVSSTSLIRYVLSAENISITVT